MRRASWLGLPLTTLILTGLALNLSPNPKGLGTHQALGLPPCFFLGLTGLPCPSCGLTTSWVHLLHGNFSQAWQAHLLGPIFYGLLCLISLMGLFIYFGKRSKFHRSLSWLKENHSIILYGALGIYFSVWIFQLVLKNSHRDWPLV